MSVRDRFSRKDAGALSRECILVAHFLALGVKAFVVKVARSTVREVAHEARNRASNVLSSVELCRNTNYLHVRGHVVLDFAKRPESHHQGFKRREGEKLDLEFRSIILSHNSLQSVRIVSPKGSQTIVRQPTRVGCKDYNSTSTIHCQVAYLLKTAIIVA